MNEPQRTAAPGSFRDPSGRVFIDGDRIVRAVDETTLSNFQKLSQEAFFQRAVEAGDVVGSSALDSKPGSWAGMIEHDRIPVITYPYEWTFSMLRSAALLQLRLLEQALENGWTIKDATPYNIQWNATKPVFIDVPSFEPWIDGEPWLAYRQFCSMFLIPLLLKAHLKIDHIPVLRSYLDGVPPTEAIKFFSGLRRLKSGVLSHVVLPASVENSIARKERDRASVQKRERRHSRPMVLGLVQSMQRLVRKLKSDIGHTDWSLYDQTHSYDDADFQLKQDFVRKNAARSNRRTVWDIGCNTGTFSRISEEFADHVVSVDGDHDAVERLYLAERKRKGSKILPLVMNLANPSPAQGWAGSERTAFQNRSSPDLVLVLALIHHMRISANIPLDLFLDWLAGLGSEIIIEFVDRDDDMVVKLLTNKKEQYPDYTKENFLSLAEERFSIVDRRLLKGGTREIFYMVPRNG